MKKNAIITFDYEVFLGRETGTIDNCVIKPTQLILEILTKNSAKAIFFVDATWLFFLRENFPSDFQHVSAQLKNIIKSGSSVELHLHPQWIDADRTGHSISFKSINHYRLHSLNNEEILDLFKKSVALLEHITTEKITCYRAGGWCIEPFSKIRPAFTTSGIKYDFSVVPGIYLKEGKPYDFDYSKPPKSPFYRFHQDTGKADSSGCFVEVPLSTYQNNFAYRIINKILLKLLKDKIYGDGKGIKEKSVYSLLYNGFRFSKAMLTLDKTNNFIFRYLLKTHFRKSQFIVIVSHPKTVSSQALCNLLHIVKKYNSLNSLDLDQYLKI